MSATARGPAQVPAPEWTSSLRALPRVAERVDPFDFVPHKGVSARIVTVGPFHLRQAEYDAVFDASGAVLALLANLTPDGEVSDGPVWSVSRTYPFEDLKSDPAWDGISQSALWGADGSWLVVVSNEGHGIAAGTEKFVDALARLLPHQDDLVEIVDRLVVGRRDSAEADNHMFAMVARVHGADEGQRIRDQLDGASND